MPNLLRLLVLGAALHFGTADATGDDLDLAPLAGLPDAIARGDYPGTTSVLIVRSGKLAYEHYFAEGSEKHLNNTRSVTKFLTTLALGAAIMDGSIPSEKARAFDYFSDLSPIQNGSPSKNAITLQDLLTMSSALSCDDNDDNSPGREDLMHEQSNWTRWAVDLPTIENYARDASGLGPWRNCTANAVLVGQVIQRATHARVDEYTNAKILRPLGIARWHWQYSPAHEAM